MRKLTLWSVIGSVWTAWWLFIAIYVTIPDAPWDYTIWYGLMYDPTAYYHEMVVILGVWLAGMLMLMLVSFWYHAFLFLKVLEKWVKGFP